MFYTFNIHLKIQSAKWKIEVKHRRIRCRIEYSLSSDKGSIKFFAISNPNLLVIPSRIQSDDKCQNKFTTD